MADEQIPFWSHYSADIIFPCLSWEVCDCGICGVQYWPTGKTLDLYCECRECGQAATTVVILATVN